MWLNISLITDRMCGHRPGRAADDRRGGPARWLALLVVFTFVYATAAARLRRAEKILLPILDVRQSVPVLGSLSMT